MKRVYFPFFIILLVSASCGKLRKETISGVVRDDTTAISIAGAEVELYEFHDYSISNAKFLTSTTTESDGTFNIKYNLGHRNPYFLRVIKSGYFPSSHTLTTSEDTRNIGIVLKRL